MLKITTFRGEIGGTSWGGMVDNSPEAQFNRWVNNNTGRNLNNSIIGTKDVNIITSQDGKYQTITVAYDVPDDYEYRPCSPEDGMYYVDGTAGKLIMINGNVDVSYMVKDFAELRKLVSPQGGSGRGVIELSNGTFYHKYEYTDGVNMYETYNRRGSCVTKTGYDSVLAGEVINHAYLPYMHLFSEFKLSDNYGQYVASTVSNTLVKQYGNLDVTYILKGFDILSRLLQLPVNKSDLLLDVSSSGFVWLNNTEIIVNCEAVVDSDYL